MLDDVAERYQIEVRKERQRGRMVREKRPSDARPGMHECSAMHVDPPCVHAGSFERFSDEAGSAADVENPQPRDCADDASYRREDDVVSGSEPEVTPLDAGNQIDKCRRVVSIVDGVGQRDDAVGNRVALLA